MSKSKMLVYLSAILLSSAAFADTLKASVDRSTIPANQNINLRLELNGSRAEAEPDLSPLAENFEITGQGQSSVSRIINGRASSSRIWELSLRPKHSGPIEIPSLTAANASSAPIPIQVTASVPAAPIRGVSFTAHAAKSEVYKGERVRVDYFLHSNRPLQNLQVPELSVANAIVERVGEPKVRGPSVEFSFFITPMQAGSLKIPPLMVQGQMAKPAVSRAMPNPFSRFMDDDQDGPFAEMQKMMKRFGAEDDNFFQGFESLQPVSLSSAPVVLNVLPPVAGVEPWLAANHISLSASLGQGPAKVGEPIESRIHEEAKGISLAQMPNLEEQLAASPDFKVYPEQSQDSQAEGETSVRDQSFSLIPQKSGQLSIPAIKIVYFDTASRTRKIAELPKKIMPVLPGATGVKTTSAEIPPSVTPPAQVRESNLGRAKEVGGGFAIAALAFAVYQILRRNKKTVARPLVETSVPVKAVSLKDLRSAKSASEIQRFLQKYAHANWDVPQNAPLMSIVNAASSKGLDRARLLSIKKILEADLYAGRPAHTAQVIVELNDVIASRRPQARQSSKFDPSLPTLNLT